MLVGGGNDDSWLYINKVKEFICDDVCILVMFVWVDDDYDKFEYNVVLYYCLDIVESVGIELID